MKLSSLLSLGIAAVAAPAVMAQSIVYQQNFDSATLGSQPGGPGSYVGIDVGGGAGWQVQGGTDGAGTVSLVAGVNTSGVGGSQALFGTWDFTSGVNYTWNQYTYYGTPAPGAGVNLSDIRVSLDLLYSGADTPPGVTISTIQGGNERTFSPTLTAGDYTSVEFGLDEMSGPAFDPAAGFWFRVSHGNGGFGFDAGNTLQIDNVMISVVPEPASSALLGLGLLGLALFRRRS
jgi:hypothetical protein